MRSNGGISSTQIAVGVEYKKGDAMPEVFAISQNYPNPFNPGTTINFQIPELSFVTIKVYDVLGNVIVILVNEEKPIGNYKIEFDATKLPSGIYFYEMRTGLFTETKKMTLLK